MLISIATPICAGALVAIALHSAAGFARIGPVLWHPLAPVGAVALVVALLWVGADPTVIGVSMAWLVAVCCVREDHILRPLLAWGPVAYVGRVSYGMYLLHFLLIPFGAILGHTFLVTFGLTFIVAANSFRFFETPLLNVKRRFSWQSERQIMSVGH